MKTPAVLFSAGLALTVVLGGGYFALRPAADDHDHASEGASIYVCPMHPWIKSTQPDKCTLCGMSLVARSGADAADLPAGTIALSPSQITTIGVATSTIARQPLTRTLRVSGRVMHDTSRVRTLTARVPGWIEKLNVTDSGQYVGRDQELATIYSPEMLTAQRVYLERLNAGVAYSASDLAAARENLLLLGLNEADITELEKTKTPSAHVVIRSPADGVVMNQVALQGQHVETNAVLAEISDFSVMWYVFDAYESDIALLQVGQLVDITTDAIPGETITEPIAFIDPNFNEGTRSTKVRVVLTNTHFAVDDQHLYMPHRVIANGRVRLNAPEVVAIPKSAVLDPGSGPVAYVELGGGGYERRKLYLGRRGDNLIEVIAGVSVGDKVVTQAALLLDAQAQLESQGMDTGKM